MGRVKELWQQAIDKEVERLVEQGWDEVDAERAAQERAGDLFQDECEKQISAAEARYE